ncbi:type II toxin-antitoxin system RelE/ParE family toxin [Sinomicrobium sp. M5D2P9]
MEFEVIWSEFAERQLDDIFEYYSENASARVAKKLVIGLINEPQKLIHNPSSGQAEPLLQERKEPYRYLGPVNTTHSKRLFGLFSASLRYFFLIWQRQTRQTCLDRQKIYSKIHLFW